MVDPQSLYKSGTPGRGKGTIIQGPNLAPLFAQVANRGMKARSAEEAARAKNAESLQKIADLGDKGFIEDREYLAAIRNGFRDDLLATYAKYGDKIPESETIRLQNERNTAMNKLQQSQRMGEEFWWYQREFSKADIDPDVREEGFSALDAWLKLKPEERPGLTNFINDKRFNLNKYRIGIAKFINDESDKVALSSGVQQGAGGRYVDVKTYAWTKQGVSEKIVTDDYKTQDQYRKRMNTLFKDFMGNNASVKTSVPYYEKINGQIVESNKTVTVTTIDDYLKYVEAPLYLNLQNDERVGMSGGMSIGINMPDPGKGTQPTEGTFSANVNGADLDFNAYSLPINVNVKQTGASVSQRKLGIKTNLPYYMASGVKLDPNGEIVFGGGDAYFPRIAEKNMNFGNGRGVIEGSPIPADLQDNYDKAGGTWHYEPWIQGGAYDNQSGVTKLGNVYIPVNGYEGNIDAIYQLAPEDQKLYGTMSNYLNKMSDEYNKQQGKTKPSTNNGSKNGGTKPPYDAKVHGSYANYKKLYP